MPTMVACRKFDHDSPAYRLTESFCTSRNQLMFMIMYNNLQPMQNMVVELSSVHGLDNISRVVAIWMSLYIMW